MSTLLERQLRASIELVERQKRMAHEDLYAAIEQRRSELHEDLTRMRAERDAYVANVNQKIKMAQDALDALPVPRQRRKSPGRKLADAVVAVPAFEDSMAAEYADRGE